MVNLFFMVKTTTLSRSNSKTALRKRYKNAAFLKQLGDHCRNLRLGLDYSIDRLSKESDQLSPASIDRLERGLADSQVLVLLRYAKTLGVTILDLFSFLKDESQSLKDPRIMPYEDGLKAPAGYVPVYPLKTSVYYLKNHEAINSIMKPLGWVDAGSKHSAVELFAGYVRGHAMEPTIPNDSLVLFKRVNGGNNRNGHIFLIESAILKDPENSESFIIRKFKKSESSNSKDNYGELTSENSAFTVIAIPAKSENEVHFLAEFLKVL